MTGNLKTLRERGIPDDSYFKLTYPDGTTVDEYEANWSDLSEKKVVGYFDNTKMVSVSQKPVSKIEMFHEGLHSEITVPMGGEVYQAIRSTTMFYGNGKRTDRVIGRIMGVVQDGEVVEEHMLNGMTGQVEGLKK